MKLTIVSSQSDEITVSQFKKKADEMGIKAKVIPISLEDIATGRANDVLDENVLWRLSPLGPSGNAIGYGLMQGRNSINSGLYVMPEIANKFFQQQFMKNSPLRQYAIPTFYANTFESLESLVNGGWLTFPMTVKSVDGASAAGLQFLESFEDVKQKMKYWGGQVFQSYIHNDGEWRVFVVGGVATGAMLKIAEKGRKFNFVTPGATIKSEDDPVVRDELYAIAARAASLFHLELNGVDIVKDGHTGKYHIFEVNTSPGWQNGFDRVTGEDIPEHVMRWFLERTELKRSGNKYEVLERYITSRLHRLSTEDQEIFVGIVHRYSQGLSPLDAIIKYKSKVSEKVKTELDEVVNTLTKPGNDYVALCKRGDAILSGAYFKTSLRKKLEFSLLARIRESHSQQEEFILQETEKAVSWAGNFVSETYEVSTTGVSSQHTMVDNYYINALYFALNHIKDKTHARVSL